MGSRRRSGPFPQKSKPGSFVLPQRTAADRPDPEKMPGLRAVGRLARCKPRLGRHRRQIRAALKRRNSGRKKALIYKYLRKYCHKITPFKFTIADIFRANY